MRGTEASAAMIDLITGFLKVLMTCIVNFPGLLVAMRGLYRSPAAGLPAGGFMPRSALWCCFRADGCISISVKTPDTGGVKA